jgi:uncharacterized protein (DUF433 family)
MPVQKLQSVAMSEPLEEKLARLKELAKTAPPITINPQRMSGAPVIGIQRMPVTTLFDYLMDGYSVDQFLEAFPGTDRDKVMAALQKIRDAFDEGLLSEVLAEKVNY